MSDKSPNQLWRKSLEYKHKKVKKKDLASMLTPYIKREDGVDTGDPANRYWVIWGTNYKGREVEIRCKERDECLANLATLNGFTVE